MQRYGGIPPFAETQAYVPAVIARWGRIAAGAAPPIVGGTEATAPTASAAPTVSAPAGTTGASTPDGAAAATVTAAGTTGTSTPDGAAAAAVTATGTSGADTSPVPAGDARATSRPAPPAAPTSAPTTVPAGTVGVDNPTAGPSPAPASASVVPTEGPASGFEQSTGGTADQSDAGGATPVPAATGTSASAPSGVAAVAGTATTQEIPAEIMRLVRQDGGMIRLQLSPQGLGDISVQVALTAGGDIAIEILADTDQAAIVLGRLRETVETALRIDGFSLDSFDVGTERDRTDQQADFVAADADAGEQPSSETGAVVTADQSLDLDAIDANVLEDAADPQVLRI